MYVTRNDKCTLPLDGLVAWEARASNGAREAIFFNEEDAESWVRVKNAGVPPKKLEAFKAGEAVLLELDEKDVREWRDLALKWRDQRDAAQAETNRLDAEKEELASKVRAREAQIEMMQEKWEEMGATVQGKGAKEWKELFEEQARFYVLERDKVLAMELETEVFAEGPKPGAYRMLGKDIYDWRNAAQYFENRLKMAKTERDKLREDVNLLEKQKASKGVFRYDRREFTRRGPGPAHGGRRVLGNDRRK